MKFSKRKKVQLIIIFFSVFVLVQFGRIFYTIIDENAEIIDAPIAEYHNLFTPEAQHKLQIIVSGKSKNRGITSSYVYDKKFNVFVFKVHLSTTNNNLQRLVSYQNESTYKSMNALYEELPSFNFNMSLKAGEIPIVSHVYFKHFGDSTKTVLGNENLLCYYFKFRTFSINYNDEPYDIIAKADKNIPASILFYKKNNVLYVLLLTVATGKEEFQPDLLYNMIKR